VNCVVVWSLMLKKIVEFVAKFLFQGCRPPFNIVGQEQCRKIETSRGKFLNHPRATYKLLWLKVLVEQLFSNSVNDKSFNNENTLLIDDSLDMSVQ